MNENKQNTHLTEPEKEMAEVIPTVGTKGTESQKMPDGDEAEETSTESLKALQKEVAEKEQQVNQQLELLWASGTQQMLGNHTGPFVAPLQQKPSQQTQTAEQQSILQELITPIEETIKEANTNKQDDSTTGHGDHELVPVENKTDEKVKKTTRKRTSSAKKKKESS